MKLFKRKLKKREETKNVNDMKKKLCMKAVPVLLVIFGLFYAPSTHAGIVGDIINVVMDHVNDGALLAQQMAQFVQDMDMHSETMKDIREKAQKLYEQQQKVYELTMKGKQAYNSVKSIDSSIRRITELITSTSERYDYIRKYGSANDIQKASMIMKAVNRNTRILLSETKYTLSEIKYLKDCSSKEQMDMIDKILEELNTEIYVLELDVEEEIDSIVRAQMFKENQKANSNVLGIYFV